MVESNKNDRSAKTGEVPEPTRIENKETDRFEREPEPEQSPSSELHEIGTAKRKTPYIFTTEGASKVATICYAVSDFIGSISSLLDVIVHKDGEK